MLKKLDEYNNIAPESGDMNWGWANSVFKMSFKGLNIGIDNSLAGPKRSEIDSKSDYFRVGDDVKAKTQNGDSIVGKISWLDFDEEGNAYLATVLDGDGKEHEVTIDSMKLADETEDYTRNQIQEKLGNL